MIGVGILIIGLIALAVFMKKKKPSPPLPPEEPDEFPFTAPSIEEFHFTEIVEDHLPDYIIGWAAASCGGIYNYIPPAGYIRTSCEMAPGRGSHGGCPSCSMCKVRCDKI